MMSQASLKRNPEQALYKSLNLHCIVTLCLGFLRGALFSGNKCSKPNLQYNFPFLPYSYPIPIFIITSNFISFSPNSIAICISSRVLTKRRNTTSVSIYICSSPRVLTKRRLLQHPILTLFLSVSQLLSLYLFLQILSLSAFL